jgi:hypothetical protein
MSLRSEVGFDLAKLDLAAAIAADADEDFGVLAGCSKHKPVNPSFDKWQHSAERDQNEQHES